ncbi:RNA polymerase II-associated protein 3, variant 4 [Balamuthia mandrillaris]
MPKKKRRSGNRAVSNNTNNAAASAGGESSHASSATTVSQDQSQPHRSHSAARLPTTGGGGGDNKVASESLLGASAPAVHEHAKLEKLRGDVDFENGKLASAVVHYTKSIALCGKNPLFLVTLFVQRARAHLLLKEYEQAVEDCGVSLRLDPNEPRAYMVRGLARFQQQRLAMALGDFARCSAMVPENQLLRQRLQTAKDELSKPKHKKINLKALEWMGDISMLHSLDVQEEHDNEDEYVEEGPNWEDEDLAAMAVTESEADCKQTRQKEITSTTLLHRKQTPYFISGDALASNTHLSVPDKMNGNNHAIDSVVEYSHKASNNLMNSVVDEDMPLLVPIGEALDAHFPHLDTLTPSQAKEQALHEKTLVCPYPLFYSGCSH